MSYAHLVYPNTIFQLQDYKNFSQIRQHSYLNSFPSSFKVTKSIKLMKKSCLFKETRFNVTPVSHESSSGSQIFKTNNLTIAGVEPYSNVMDDDNSDLKLTDNYITIGSYQNSKNNNENINNSYIVDIDCLSNKDCFVCKQNHVRSKVFSPFVRLKIASAVKDCAPAYSLPNKVPTFINSVSLPLKRTKSFSPGQLRPFTKLEAQFLTLQESRCVSLPTSSPSLGCRHLFRRGIDKPFLKPLLFRSYQQGRFFVNEFILTRGKIKNTFDAALLFPEISFKEGNIGSAKNKRVISSPDIVIFKPNVYSSREKFYLSLTQPFSKVFSCKKLFKKPFIPKKNMKRSNSADYQMLYSTNMDNLQFYSKPKSPTKLKNYLSPLCFSWNYCLSSEKKGLSKALNSCNFCSLPRSRKVQMSLTRTKGRSQYKESLSNKNSINGLMHEVLILKDMITHSQESLELLLCDRQRSPPTFSLTVDPIADLKNQVLELSRDVKRLQRRVSKIYKILCKRSIEHVPLGCTGRWPSSNKETNSLFLASNTVFHPGALQETGQKNIHRSDNFESANQDKRTTASFSQNNAAGSGEYIEPSLLESPPLAQYYLPSVTENPITYLSSPLSHTPNPLSPLHVLSQPAPSLTASGGQTLLQGAEQVDGFGQDVNQNLGVSSDVHSLNAPVEPPWRLQPPHYYSNRPYFLSTGSSQPPPPALYFPNNTHVTLPLQYQYVYLPNGQVIIQALPIYGPQAPYLAPLYPSADSQPLVYFYKPPPPTQVGDFGATSQHAQFQSEPYPSHLSKSETSVSLQSLSTNQFNNASEGIQLTQQLSSAQPTDLQADDKHFFKEASQEPGKHQTDPHHKPLQQPPEQSSPHRSCEESSLPEIDLLLPKKQEQATQEQGLTPVQPSHSDISLLTSEQEQPQSPDYIEGSPLPAPLVKVQFNLEKQQEILQGSRSQRQQPHIINQQPCSLSQESSLQLFSSMQGATDPVQHSQNLLSHPPPLHQSQTQQSFPHPHRQPAHSQPQSSRESNAATLQQPHPALVPPQLKAQQPPVKGSTPALQTQSSVLFQQEQTPAQMPLHSTAQQQMPTSAASQLPQGHLDKQLKVQKSAARPHPLAQQQPIPSPLPAQVCFNTTLQVQPPQQAAAQPLPRQQQTSSQLLLPSHQLQAQTQFAVSTQLTPSLELETTHLEQSSKASSPSPQVQTPLTPYSQTTLNHLILQPPPFATPLPSQLSQPSAEITSKPQQLYNFSQSQQQLNPSHLPTAPTQAVSQVQRVSAQPPQSPHQKVQHSSQPEQTTSPFSMNLPYQTQWNYQPSLSQTQPPPASQASNLRPVLAPSSEIPRSHLVLQPQLLCPPQQPSPLQHNRTSREPLTSMPLTSIHGEASQVPQNSQLLTSQLLLKQHVRSSTTPSQQPFDSSQPQVPPTFPLLPQQDAHSSQQQPSVLPSRESFITSPLDECASAPSHMLRIESQEQEFQTSNPPIPPLLPLFTGTSQGQQQPFKPPNSSIINTMYANNFQPQSSILPSLDQGYTQYSYPQLQPPLRSPVQAPSEYHLQSTLPTPSSAFFNQNQQRDVHQVPHSESQWQLTKEGLPNISKLLPQTAKKPYFEDTKSDVSSTYCIEKVTDPLSKDFSKLSSAVTTYKLSMPCGSDQTPQPQVPSCTLSESTSQHDPHFSSFISANSNVQAQGNLKTESKEEISSMDPLYYPKVREKSFPLLECDNKQKLRTFSSVAQPFFVNYLKAFFDRDFFIQQKETSLQQLSLVSALRSTITSTLKKVSPSEVLTGMSGKTNGLLTDPSPLHISSFLSPSFIDKNQVPHANRFLPLARSYSFATIPSWYEKLTYARACTSMPPDLNLPSKIKSSNTNILQVDNEVDGGRTLPAEDIIVSTLSSESSLPTLPLSDLPPALAPDGPLIVTNVGHSPETKLPSSSGSLV